METLKISDEELSERLRLSHQRMSEPFYDIDNVFAPIDARWPGDKEGRALLAFVSLADAGQPEVPCMEQMIEKLPSMLNEKKYLGPVKDAFFEQQMSGHSWMLRGLCAYYERYKKPEILDYINGIVENLFLPLLDVIADYPVRDRIEVDNGGADGHSIGLCGGWILSTDTCCAFMSIDGLSHVYKVTKDARVLKLLDQMVDTFMQIDKQVIKAQTHCTLTAARGMMRLYTLTQNEKYLNSAKFILHIYKEYGMTYTFENFNWWGRPDSWTEPCAVIDSLMLSTELYKVTGDEEYRVLAARIFHNGFPPMQRPNGGAGTQSIVCPLESDLYIRSYETKQCCTMRLSEGLRYIKENKDLLYARTDGAPVKNEKGIYMSGDIIYAKTVGDETEELHPLLKFYKMTTEEITGLSQRVIFN